MAKPKKIKVVDEKEIEKIEEVETKLEEAKAAPGFDPDIPENKQRWLR